MPLLTPEARIGFLSLRLGPTRAPASPDSYDVALFDDDPAIGGTEITGDGYGRANVLADDFTLEGEAFTAMATFPAPDDVWDEANYFVLYDPVTGYAWDAVPLKEPVVVGEAGPAPLLQLSIYFGDALTDEEP